MTDTRYIAHLTDSHLLADPDACLHGWAVAEAFKRVWADMRACLPAPDALVLGGDLVDDRSPAGYRWLADQLAALDCPVLAVAGNHDDPHAMTQHLRGAHVHGALYLGPWRLIGLNTQVPGAEHGQLRAHDRRRLDTALADPTRQCLVVMHHPPIAVGTAWIDAIGLVDQTIFADQMAGGASCRGVLAGHVHQAFTGALGDCPIWTTPSTMRQFLPGARTFAEDEAAPPGWRWLALHDDGRIETGIRRLGDRPRRIALKA